MWSGTKTHRRTGPPVLTTPNTGKRGEKRAEGGNELDTRQGVGSSAHLKLDKGTVLTAGMASRRGTRLSSMSILEHCSGVRSSQVGDRVANLGDTTPLLTLFVVYRTVPALSAGSGLSSGQPNRILVPRRLRNLRGQALVRWTGHMMKKIEESDMGRGHTFVCRRHRHEFESTSPVAEEAGVHLPVSQGR